ncbi:MAG: hypothetical protein J2P16_00475 [Mycobacterium sp.]|nr:hypothetical protein [Mycobacterium sp.]
MTRRRALVTAVCSFAAVLIALSAIWLSNRPDRPSASSSAPLAEVGTAPPPVPDYGAYLGASVSPDHYTEQNRIDAMARFERKVGAAMSIAHIYVRWGAPLARPSNVSAVRSGHLLLVSWAITDTRVVSSGSQDAIIESMARQLAALRRPVFLEPRWEMDRPNLAATVHSADDFIAAWDRLRTVFATIAPKNVSWVWCPTAAGFASGRAQAYYPGDNEVDWVCADAYPAQAYIPGTYQSFAASIEAFVQWIGEHTKPAMIGEFGVPKSYGAKRAPWLAAAARYIRSVPQIKAAVYFDGPSGSTPDLQPSNDYRLQGNPTALQAFAAIAHEKYFRVPA